MSGQNLSELKELAQTDEIIATSHQEIYCPVCDRRRRQVITTFAKLQIRDCEGTYNGRHTLYYDRKGKYLYAVEHRDGYIDWREPIDHARTEGVKPQTMAWEVDRRPRRKGGRKPGGSGWTEYVNPDSDDEQRRL